MSEREMLIDLYEEIYNEIERRGSSWTVKFHGRDFIVNVREIPWAKRTISRALDELWKKTRKGRKQTFDQSRCNQGQNLI